MTLPPAVRKLLVLETVLNRLVNDDLLDEEEDVSERGEDGEAGPAELVGRNDSRLNFDRNPVGSATTGAVGARVGGDVDAGGCSVGEGSDFVNVIGEMLESMGSRTAKADISIPRGFNHFDIFSSVPAMSTVSRVHNLFNKDTGTNGKLTSIRDDCWQKGVEGEIVDRLTASSRTGSVET